MKKILLLTDIPPCKNLTAGLVLDQLCRFLPKESVVCFSVVNPSIEAKISSDLDWIPIEYCKKPMENSGQMFPRPLGQISSLSINAYHSLVTINALTKKIVEFGRKHRVDAVWCVLQGQTMIRLALPVAEGLGVSLFTQVWDPPYWWLRENKVDALSSKLVLKEFSRVLRGSAACAAASWAMAEQYRAEFKTRALPVIPSLDANLALRPATEIHEGNELIIGLAGQIYSVQEWHSLIAALDSVNWEIAGRKVKIRLLGRYANLYANGKMHIEFLGWTSQVDTIKLMSEADILYCPYWFDPVFESEARLSFPSKLTTYLAAGRPVLFHGPAYASPGRFLQDNKAGICCNSLEKNDIIKALQLLASDQNLYSTLTRNGSSAFDKHLTLVSMKAQFYEFLDIAITAPLGYKTD